MGQCAQYSTLSESEPQRAIGRNRASREQLPRSRRNVTAGRNLDSRDVTDNLDVPRKEEFDSKQGQIRENKDETPVGSPVLRSRDPFAEEPSNLGTKLKGELGCADERAVRIHCVKFHRSGSSWVGVKQCQARPPGRQIDNLRKQKVRLGVHLRRYNRH